MKKDGVLEAMRKWVESPDYDDKFNKMVQLLDVNEKYIDRFHNLTPEQRLDIVKKMVAKYESDEYYMKETKKGYEPRKELYYLLFNYGKKYGKDSFDNLNDYFPEEKVIIDNRIEVSQIIGQGTVYNVNFL